MIRRLNHAVLYVRDAQASAAFYREVLGFEVSGDMGPHAQFLRAGDSRNDHDLGLFSVGNRPATSQPGIGLYHLAWQVDTLEQLMSIRRRLADVGSLAGESDHGVSKSLYARDPDGIEFEVMWAVPQDSWGGPGTRRVNWDDELARWAGVATAGELGAGRL
jgi:catechol-2,3-dioxygenase